MNNMSMTGMERCNKGDRQMLGVYLPANSSLSIKNIDTGFDSNMTVTCFTNTRAQNSILNIKSNNEYQYITNIRNSISYDCVPLLTSPRLSTEDIDKTFKIEIKYDNSVNLWITIITRMMKVSSSLDGMTAKIVSLSSIAKLSCL